VNETCWLCLQPFEPGEPTDRHHVKPKRLCNSQEKRDQANLVRVHVLCHRRHHLINDSPKWNRDTFERVMRPRGYGYGFFSGESAYMAAD
jgi:hypothetical protein